MGSTQPPTRYRLKAKAQPVENFAGAGELFAMEVRPGVFHQPHVCRGPVAGETEGWVFPGRYGDFLLKMIILGCLGGTTI